MAEWILLIMALLLGFGVYALNQRVYESQSLLVWSIAAAIMALTLLIYIFSKVQSAGQPWADRYEIEQDP